MSKKRTVALLVAGVMIGLLFTPLPAQAALTINKIWKGIMPKADARYVQQGAVAYAQVNTNPAVFNAPRTKNFTGVSNPFTGTYCLTPTAGVDLATHPAVATPEFGGSAGGDLQVYIRESANDCPAGALEVITLNAGAWSNSTAFTVWVP